MGAASPLLTGALSLVIGGFVGLSLGLVGAGGSILTVPALIYGLRVPVREAIPAALVLVGLIAANGAAHHARDGTVRIGIALRFGLAGVIGALVGSRLSTLVEPKTLLVMFAGVMLLAALSLARRDAKERPNGPAVDDTFEHPSWGRLLAVGFAVGMMTGFFGVGGGFIVVPALGLFVGLPTRQAVATSLVVIVINCLSGLAGHITAGNGVTSGVAVLLLLFGIGGAIGSTTGARLAGRWPDATLSRVFAVIVAGVAVFLLVKNLGGGHGG